MDIVLGNYKGLKANIPYIAYTEEDVNSQIATLLSGNPVREQKTGPLAMGDTAVIDYEGFKDGVAFEGGKEPCCQMAHHSQPAGRRPEPVRSARQRAFSGCCVSCVLLPFSYDKSIC